MPKELLAQLVITVLKDQLDQHHVQQVLILRAHLGRNPAIAHLVSKGTIVQHQQQLLTLHMFAKQVSIAQQAVMLQPKLFVQLVIDAQLAAHHQRHVQIQTSIRMKQAQQYAKIVQLDTIVPNTLQLSVNHKTKVQTTIVLVV